MIYKTDNQQISVGMRLATMLLDHFIMSMIAGILFLPSFIAGISAAFRMMSDEQVRPDFTGGTFGYIGILGFALYLCKDIFNGRSIAKRIIKLQVVDNKTGEVASPLQSFIRNILCFLWPVEVIAAMINTNRRLGDRIAGTRLVRFDPRIEQPKINIGKLIVPLVISYGLMLALVQAMPKFGTHRAPYIETSYNQAESAVLEKALTDSLRQYCTPDIKIYDSVRGENLKYVSIILQLKENYIEDDQSFSELNEKTTNLIYSKFPKETFQGQLRYVYKRPGEMQSRMIWIGTYLRSKGRR